MNDSLKLQLQFKYTELVQLWQSFCELHTKLYELTTSEYQALLESRIEDLEGLIKQKEQIIESIRLLDNQRAEVVNHMAHLAGTSLDKLSDLYPLVEEYQLDSNKSIERYNLLLLDIVEKIQEQNKKNQIFLNKAILSLQDLKDQFKGKKNFKTYNSRGNTLSP